MSCDQELNTQSYLDGELQGAAAAEADRPLQSYAACQALAAATADLSAALSLPVADLALEGLALPGGRVDEAAGRRAAVMVYRPGNHQLDLFAWPDRGARLPQSGMSHGFRTGFWKSGDLDFAAVSDVDEAEFQKFIALARAQRE